MHGEKQAPRIENCLSLSSLQKGKNEQGACQWGMVRTEVGSSPGSSQQTTHREEVGIFSLCFPTTARTFVRLTESWVRFCLLPALAQTYISVLGECPDCGCSPTELFHCPPNHCDSGSSASDFKLSIWLKDLDSSPQSSEENAGNSQRWNWHRLLPEQSMSLLCTCTFLLCIKQ